MSSDFLEGTSLIANERKMPQDRSGYNILKTLRLDILLLKK